MLHELLRSPSTSTVALMDFCRACTREGQPPSHLLVLALRLLQALLQEASLPSAVVRSHSAAELIVDLLASDAVTSARSDDNDDVVGAATESAYQDSASSDIDTGANAAAVAARLLAAQEAHQRLEVCATLLHVGGPPLCRQVDGLLQPRPWLSGLCTQALLSRIRIGLRAARSPLLRASTTSAAAAASSSPSPLVAAPGRTVAKGIHLCSRGLAIAARVTLARALH